MKYCANINSYLQLKNVKVEESFGALDNYRLTATSATTAKSLQQYPLRFVIDNGMIKDLQPVLTERQKDILNIKRGILSAFQVKWSKKSTSTEVHIEVLFYLSSNENVVSPLLFNIISN